MKFQYLIASCITTSIIAVSATYAENNYLQFSRNPNGIIRMIKQEQYQAQVPPNPGIPTGRESGASRQLKQIP